jgi:chromosome segregation ATPase
MDFGMSTSSKLRTAKKNNDNADIYWSTELPSARKNIEFVLECREMAGRLVIYYLNDDELRAAAESTAKRTNYIESKNADIKDYTLGMGYDAEILLWLINKSEVYQQLEREAFRGLCRTLARRIFELNKGQQNKQLLIDRKNDLMSHKSKLESADADIKKLEATKESLATQLEQSLADAANLKSRLREEQEQTAIIERKHRDVQRATSATLYDLKNECARKDALLQRSLLAVQEERKLGEERREAVILDLQRALDGERSAESARRQAHQELKALEREFQRQASANDTLVNSLRKDVDNVTEQKRAISEAYDKRMAVLLTKLKDTEAEVLQSRNIIKNLKKELHILTTFDGN